VRDVELPEDRAMPLNRPEFELTKAKDLRQYR
jgi:hypothetical protein